MIITKGHEEGKYFQLGHRTLTGGMLLLYSA